LGKPFEETDQSIIWKGKDYSASIRQEKVTMDMNKKEATI